MATHKANLNFYLYTGFDENSLNSVQAYQHLKGSGIQFTHMHYHDPDQNSLVLNWVKNVFVNTEYNIENAEFPFIVYEKAFDIRDNPPRQRVLVHGISNILATDWTALEAFEG